MFIEQQKKTLKIFGLGPRVRKTCRLSSRTLLGSSTGKLIYKGLKKYKVDFVTSDRKVKKKTLIKKKF